MGAAGNQQLNFAIRAVNEASKVLKDIGGDFDNVGEHAEEAAQKTGRFGEKVGEVGERGGDAESAFRGLTDITGVMGDQFGLALGPLQGWGLALADVGGGIESLIRGAPGLISAIGSMFAALPGVIAQTWAYVAALTAQAAAFIAANAPLIAIIAGIALLAAGIVLLITHWDDIVDKVPLLGAAFDAAMAVIKGAFSAVTSAAETVISFMRDHWPEVVTLLAGPFAPIVAVATDAFGIRTALIGGFQAVLDWLTSTWTTISGAVTSAFQAAIDWVTNNWPIIAALISGPFAPIVLLATDAFGVRSALVAAFHAVWDAITGTIGTLGAFITNLVPDVLAAASALGSAIVDGISQGVTGLVNIGEDLGIVIANGVIDAINFVIDKVNRALEFDVDLWVKTIHIDPPDIPHVPHLAAGGIVTRPTLAMIGEGGYPEAVVPLAGPNAPGGLSGATYNLHFHGFVGDVDALIVEMERRRVFA